MKNINNKEYNDLKEANKAIEIVYNKNKYIKDNFALIINSKLDILLEKFNKLKKILSK